MKTRRVIGVVGSALLILVLLLILTDPWSTLRKDGKRTVLTHPASVDRIILTDPSDSTLLEKKEGKWTLAGGEEVNPVTVENLLFAAEKLQINSILAEGKGPAAGRGRKISFNSGDHEVLAYELFPEGDRFMLRPKGSGRTYYVSVTGYSGLDLGRVFSASANHYRQHILIDLLPSEISAIRIELPDGEAFAFQQDREGNINCTALNDRTTLPEQDPDELAVRLLFSYFTSIRYEYPSGILQEELEANREKYPQLALLQVSAFSDIEHTFRVFPSYPSEGSEPDMFRALVLFDQQPEALVVNYIYLDVLMRGLSHYF
ncbi:MAG: hypothetical protein ACWGNV_09565 [Bacteroidales bacterium]